MIRSQRRASLLRALLQSHIPEWLLTAMEVDGPMLAAVEQDNPFLTRAFQRGRFKVENDRNEKPNPIDQSDRRLNAFHSEENKTCFPFTSRYLADQKNPPT